MKNMISLSTEEKIQILLDKKQYDFEDLILLLEVLRSEQGCPWDREQTHQSIRKDLIEETYEVIEAIDTEDPILLREELGDLLLQIVFHAGIEAEKGSFTVHDVANDICVKLIHRHPHVFGEVQADTSEKVLANWEVIKSEEKERITVTDKLRAIPPMLPALMRAEKVGKKAKCFDFADADEAMDKVCEELIEFSEVMQEKDQDCMEEEMGDLLLTLTSLCRKTGIEPERALYRATEKFINRFEKLEQTVLADGKRMDELTMAEMDEIWEQNKKNGKSGN